MHQVIKEKEKKETRNNKRKWNIWNKSFVLFLNVLLFVLVNLTSGGSSSIKYWAQHEEKAAVNPYIPTTTTS